MIPPSIASLLLLIDLFIDLLIALLAPPLWMNWHDPSARMNRLYPPLPLPSCNICGIWFPPFRTRRVNPQYTSPSPPTKQAQTLASSLGALGHSCRASSTPPPAATSSPAPP
ncbi:hypothetical protein K432DRAFT_199093 [Lepidopterella palustris CBS 459.81]|uniref:Uncharacterized protein n=1 Tax=Lepidopterella palustris CBS 459.81 TaxID=1314670 RepID=A0A8E2EFS7_9PEZI|nr:hypothetical protein K432DRAFT_199093 [Lepidopterella palustris CBS 459.81]